MRRWPMRSAVLALAAVLFSVNCDRSPTAESPLSPSVESSDLLGLPKLFGARDGDSDKNDDKTSNDSDRTSNDQNRDRSGGLVFVEESVVQKDQFGSLLIGLLGGVLHVGDHLVDVPRGAVLQPTLFTMLVPSTPVIDVELNALLPDGLRALLQRIGLFRQPVRLEMSYAHAKGDIDPDRLVIVRLLDNGQYEIMPTRVDRRRRVIYTDLEHFSKYAMASN